VTARSRTLVIILSAAILVTAIAFILRATDHDPLDSAAVSESPLVSAVTGTTDRLTVGETETALSVLPATDRVQPSEDEWAELLPRLLQLVAAAPEDVNARRALALAYYNLGRFDDALAIYESLLASADDPVLRNRLGNTLRDMGDIAGAEDAYREALVADPTLAAPYLNLAELLWRQGRDQEALTIIDEGLKLVPEEDRAALEAGCEVLEGSG